MANYYPLWRQALSEFLLDDRWTQLRGNPRRCSMAAFPAVTFPVFWCFSPAAAASTLLYSCSTFCSSLEPGASYHCLPHSDCHLPPSGAVQVPVWDSFSGQGRKQSPCRTTLSLPYLLAPLSFVPNARHLEGWGFVSSVHWKDFLK